MSTPGSLSRRELLHTGSAGIITALAGCALRGGGASSPANPSRSPTPSTTFTTGTDTSPTTDTARSAREVFTPKPANVGAYTDWMVAKEGASLFLFNYYPRYSWLVDQLPDEDRWGESVVRDALTSEITPSGLTGLVDPANVTEYFYGFTDVNELKYDLLWGEFDVERIVSTATAEPESEDSPGPHGFTAADATVGEFDLYHRDTLVFGITPEMMIIVNATYPDKGYTGTIADFRDIHDRVVRGEGGSFTDVNENYSLLTEHLQQGHKIICRPLVAKRMGLGTLAYARQFALVSQEYSLVDDVFVLDHQPREADVRETITESNRYSNAPIDGAGIEDIVVDGRAAVVRYSPISNRMIYPDPPYSGG